MYDIALTMKNNKKNKKPEIIEKKYIDKIMTKTISISFFINVKKKKQNERSICTHVHVVTVGQRLLTWLCKYRV